MGMYLGLASVSTDTIARLHGNPALVWLIVAPDDPDAAAKAHRPRRPGLLGRLFGTRPTPAPPETSRLNLAPDEGEVGNLEKAWHGIHYLLTGTAWDGEPPLNFLLAGGRDVGDEDVGNAIPRTFAPSDVRAIASALAMVSDDQLRARFAPLEMMALEIYPEIWDRDPAEDDTLGYLMAYVGELRRLLAVVVERGHGLLVTLT